MGRFAIPLLLAAALLVPAQAQTVSSRVVTTGTAALRVFNTGYVGANVGIPTDTTFNFVPVAAGSPSPLYEGQLLIAVSPTQISGQPYADNPSGTNPNRGFNWTIGSGPATIAAPAPFTVGVETAFTDAGVTNPDPAGLSVVQRAFGRTGDPFVVVEYTVSSATARTGVYIGQFADFDLTATATDDRGNFDAATRTVFAWKGTAGGNRNYYGVSLLGGAAASGWNVSTATDTPAGLYAALTQAGAAALANQDRRLVVGAGPFALAAGQAQTVRFAFVAGTSQADLLVNAAAAQALFPVANEGGPGQALGLRLAAPAPNPAAGHAALSFTLDAARAVRLTLVDVLGREVAVVAEGAYAAGTHPVRADLSGLGAGLYVVRIAADGAVATQRLSVVR